MGLVTQAALMVDNYLGIYLEQRDATIRCLWLGQLPPNWPIGMDPMFWERRAMADIPPPHTVFGKIPGRYWNPCRPIITGSFFG